MQQDGKGLMMTRCVRACAVVVACFLVLARLGGFQSLPVLAAPLTVTNCASSGAGSLAVALSFAVSGDTIGFTPGLNCSNTGLGPILVTGTLAISVGLTIDGTGATIVLDGGCTGCGPGGTPSGGVQVFNVTGSGPVTFGNLTIQHANTAGLGGAINISGTANVTVRNTLLFGNNAADGAAISIPTGAGTVTVRDSIISTNRMTGIGGAIINSGAATFVTGTTFFGNAAGINGGGFNNQSNGNARISNSTFVNNSSGSTGGAATNVGNLTLTNVTVSGNTGVGAGGIASISTHMTLTNTIVANSTGSDLSNLNPTPFAGTNNLIDDAATGTGFFDSINGNVVGHPALLGTLSSNGGPTQTVPLLPGSPAIGHGSPTACAAVGAGNVNGLDQRDVTRPTTLCAMGAFEPLLSAISPAVGPPAGGTAVTLMGTGFAAGAAVSIGGVSCTNVQVVNSTTLTCTTGAHTAAAADVVVTVGSVTGTLTGGYTYGVVSALPGRDATGGAPGSPNTLPSSRPPGTTGSSAPNPLPPSRP